MTRQEILDAALLLPAEDQNWLCARLAAHAAEARTAAVLTTEEADLVDQGRVMAAIRLLRERCGYSLVDAKKIVDGYRGR